MNLQYDVDFLQNYRRSVSDSVLLTRPQPPKYTIPKTAHLTAPSTPISTHTPLSKDFLNEMVTVTKPPFTPPSAEEASRYYIGLPGVPKLVARIGSRVFEHDPLEHGDRRAIAGPQSLRKCCIPKATFPIGQHALRQHVDSKVDGSDAPTLREEIIKSIHHLQRLSLDFISIGTVQGDGLSIYKKDVKPTILITVAPTSTKMKDAEHALTQIWEACAKRGMFDVEIEIMEGFGRRAGEEDEGEGEKEKNGVVDGHGLDYPYDQYPMCGTSLGCEADSYGVGTLGCYITIDGPHAGHYILTNDHVAFNDDNDRPKASSPYNNFASKRSVYKDNILSPANKDHRRLLEYFDSAIPSYRRECHELNSKYISAQDSGERFSRGEERQMNTSLSCLASLTQHQQFTSKFDRHLGYVKFASGFRRNADMSRLDWALVSLDQDRFRGLRYGLNKFPPFSQYAIRHHGLSNDFKDRFCPMQSGRLGNLSNFEAVEQAWKSGELESDENGFGRVFKCGRTSRWTMGILNQIKSNCWRDGIETREVTILNVMDSYGFSVIPFSSRGDSGSVVLDTQGRIIGLLHGLEGSTDTPKVSIFTRITPIAAIIEDIKMVTGATRVEFEPFESPFET